MMQSEEKFICDWIGVPWFVVWDIDSPDGNSLEHRTNGPACYSPDDLEDYTYKFYNFEGPWS
jgi:hypothetical protein